MSDKWLNIGYEDNILKPYTEPPPDYNDTERLGKSLHLIHGKRFVDCPPFF